MDDLIELILRGAHVWCLKEDDQVVLGSGIGIHDWFIYDDDETLGSGIGQPLENLVEEGNGSGSGFGNGGGVGDGNGVRPFFAPKREGWAWTIYLS